MTAPTRAPRPRTRSVRVLVLAPGARLLGLGLRRSLEQERRVGGDERIRGRHGVGVVHASVVTREGDEARALTQPVLELGSALPPPVLEPLRRVVDDALDLRDLLRLLG